MSATMNADVIVAGLGAAGSATLYQLARRGVRAIGLDRFAPPHAMGSTHGETRITRLAIGEGAHYTPLAVRSHEIWRELEAATGARLLTMNGGLVISEAGGSTFHGASFFRTTLEAAERHAIPHEVLNAGEIRRRFRQFAVSDAAQGYFEPSAGFLEPEACVAAQLAEAARLGAEVRLEEAMLAFEPTAHGVAVTTPRGRYDCGTLVLALGPWAPQIAGRWFPAPLKVFRQVLYWFDVGDDYAEFAPERFPVFIWELPSANGAIYGFPVVGGAKGGFKVATEHFEAETTPEAAARQVTPEETAEMHARFVAPYFAKVRPTCLRQAVCLYTMTPDFGFVVDRAPEAARVILASPCSGHGFKHSAALGEAIAEMAADGASRLDLSAFALSRFVSGE
jgi:sarcosine oxidase